MGNVCAVQKHGFGRCQVNRKLLDDSCEPILQRIGFVLLSFVAAVIEELRERTEYIDIFLFFRPSLSRVLFPMFCLLVEGECQILVF